MATSKDHVEGDVLESVPKPRTKDPQELVEDLERRAKAQMRSLLQVTQPRDSYTQEPFDPNVYMVNAPLEANRTINIEGQTVTFSIDEIASIAAEKVLAQYLGGRLVPVDAYAVKREDLYSKTDRSRREPQLTFRFTIEETRQYPVIRHR